MSGVIQPSQIDAAFIELFIEEMNKLVETAPATQNAATTVGTSDLRRMADAPPAFDGHKTVPGVQTLEAPEEEVPLRLRVVVADASEQIVELGDQPVTIGRRSSNTITVVCDRLSRQHARIWQDDLGVHLEDLGSANGTRVNSVRVGACDLTVGDVVKLGSVLVYLEEDKERFRL